MSEQPQYPPAFVPPEQAQAAVADQLTAQAEITGDADTVAAQTIDQIRAQVTREVLLPMEEKFDALMAAVRAESAAQADRIKALQAQVAAAQASVGPPDVLKYAQAVYDRVGAAAAQEGPSRREQWAGTVAAADQLLAAAKEAVQSGDGAALAAPAAAVSQWATRGYQRAGLGHHQEHFAPLLDELDSLSEATSKLVPVPAG